MERGLLVTRFWYIRPVNPQTVQLTGLTRDGLFLIENGEITQPVMNFRFNESPVRLLQNAMSSDRPQRARGGEGAGHDRAADSSRRTFRSAASRTRSDAALSGHRWRQVEHDSRYRR